MKTLQGWGAQNMKVEKKPESGKISKWDLEEYGIDAQMTVKQK